MENWWFLIKISRYPEYPYWSGQFTSAPSELLRLSSSSSSSSLRCSPFSCLIISFNLLDWHLSGAAGFNYPSNVVCSCHFLNLQGLFLSFLCNLFYVSQFPQFSFYKADRRRSPSLTGFSFIFWVWFDAFSLICFFFFRVSATLFQLIISLKDYPWFILSLRIYRKQHLLKPIFLTSLFVFMHNNLELLPSQTSYSRIQIGNP